MDYKEILELLLEVERKGAKVRYEVTNKILDALFAEYKRGSESAHKICMDMLDNKYQVKNSFEKDDKDLKELLK